MLKFFGTGHLTADPETRVTPKGKSITQARIALNREFQDGEGKIHEQVDFWNVRVFAKRGEAFAKYLKKGSKVAVSGRLEQDHWTDKETNKERSAPVLIVEDWEFADSKKPEGVPAGASAASDDE